MEPLSAAAIATLVLTKLFETTGEKLGENLMDRGGKLLQLLRRKSPEAVAALEPAEDKPLDYGQAVLAVEAAVKADPEIAEAVRDTAKMAEANPDITSKLPSWKEKLLSSPTVQNSAQLAEKINGLFQGNTINARNVAGNVVENKTEKGDVINNF